MAMFDFNTKTLTLDGKTAPITEFKVGFYTPWGLIDKFEEAVIRCAELDMDPTLVVQPVIVILDKAGRSEIFTRH